MEALAADECDGTDPQSDCAHTCASGYEGGSVTCTGDPGASASTDGAWSVTACTNIDECTAGPGCDANAACADTDGSFTCTCNSGYSGDGTTGGTGCTDIDECGASDNCDTSTADDGQVAGVCTNTAGSFTCACNTGWTGDGTGDGSCTPDDCSANVPSGPGMSTDCDAMVTGETCTQTCAAGYADNSGVDGGSEQYTCPDGTFTGTVLTCTDIDECADTTAACGTGAHTCTESNDDGGIAVTSWECACLDGAEGGGSETACTPCAVRS